MIPFLLDTSEGFVIVRFDGSQPGAEAVATNRGYKNVRAIRVASEEEERIYPMLDLDPKTAGHATPGERPMALTKQLDQALAGERVTAITKQLDQALTDLLRQAVADDPSEAVVWASHFRGRVKDINGLADRCAEAARRFEGQHLTLLEYEKAREQLAKMIKAGQ